MKPELAKQVLSGESGSALKEFLARVIVSLDSVADIEAKDPVQVAVEVKARKLAQEKLTAALSMLVSLADIQRAEGEKNEFGM